MQQRRTKVLFVITKSNWGGAQRYVFDLATHLAGEEFDVSIALGGDGLLNKRLQRASLRTISIPHLQRDMSLAKEWRSFFFLLRLFGTERPDVVHLNSSKAGGLGALAARLRSVRTIIFTVHGFPHEEERGAAARGAIWLATWVTFLLCHRVITISKANYERAQTFPLCSRKIVLIYNGIGPLKFLPREGARAELSKKMHAPSQERIWIGTIAELTWNKGLHHLIRAAAMAKRRGATFLISIIGEGEERSFLLKLIEEEGLQKEIALVGFVEEAYDYLHAFDIFALTSVKEGLPYVLLEAGQAGRAVLASHTVGNPEIIIDQQTGLLVEPKDSADIAEKLETLIKNSDLRKQLGDALQHKVQSEFSIEQMLAETKRIYQS